MATIRTGIRRAVETMALAPDDRVLEVGCGPGAAAELVCAGLSHGRMLAVDRSAVAVRRAAERNAAHVAAGRLEVRRATLAELDLPPGSFDVAFAVNVNVFWTSDAAAELDALGRVLVPGGRLLLAYGDGPAAGMDQRHLDRVEASVAASPWFEVAHRLDGDHGSALVAVRKAGTADSG